MVDSRWALRTHAACEWVVWAACMNALWLLGTAAGAVVWGAGPATTAVTTLTRRRLRGEHVRVASEFGRTWRREFGGSQVTVGLPLLAALLITVQAMGRLATSPDLWAAALVAAAVFASVLATVSAVMYAHYDLPLRTHLLTASRWTLRSPGPALLLIATAVSVVAATAVVPALAAFFSIGVWLTASTALCIDVFAANDAALSPTNEGVHP